MKYIAFLLILIGFTSVNVFGAGMANTCSMPNVTPGNTTICTVSNLTFTASPTGSAPFPSGKPVWSVTSSAGTMTPNAGTTSTYYPESSFAGVAHVKATCDSSYKIVDVTVKAPGYGAWTAVSNPAISSVSAAAGAAVCPGELSTATLTYNLDCGKKSRIDTNGCSGAQTQNWCFSSSESWIATDTVGNQVANGTGKSASFTAPGAGKYTVAFSIQANASNPNATGSASGSTTVEVSSPSGSLKQISFTGSHQLYENSSDHDGWGVGAAINNPVWTNTGTNAPICYTKGNSVSMTVKLDVNGNLPPGVSKTVTLLADGPGSLDATTTFDVTGSNTVEKTVTLSTSGALSNFVYKATPTFAWKIICGSSTNSVGSSSHTIYVTFGSPDPAGDATVKRIDWAVSTCSGQAAEHDCVAKIHDAVGSYNLQRPTPPDPIWVIAGGVTAQCQELSTFYAAATHLLGIPGGAVVYLYPKPGKTVKETATSGNNESRAVATSSPSHPSGTTHDDLNANEIIGFTDGGGGLNNFEACFKFTVGGTTKYYAGGADTYGTPQEVMNAICDFTNWYYVQGFDLATGEPIYSLCSNPGPDPVDNWP